MFDSSVKRKNPFLLMLIMTQSSVMNKNIGFGVGHLGSSATYKIPLSLNSYLSCDAHTYLIGFL